jgi:MFS family permease
MATSSAGSGHVPRAVRCCRSTTRRGGHSALDAGLLLAPQGVGAAITMPFAGRLTDRIGPGRLVMAGLALVVFARLPFAVADTSGSYAQLALVLRGVGMGASTMPAVAGAYATLPEDAVARAASALNVMRRLGGSVGVALLAVVLEHHLPGAGGGIQDRAAPTSVVADAFHATFWWVVAFAAVALVPAAFLPRRPAVARERPVDADRPHRLHVE